MDGKFVTKNAEDTKTLAKKFATSLKPGETLLLVGDLGAGKTTFVQGLAQGLGISERILSPTFVLQRMHRVSGNEIKTLNHIDLYRLDGEHAIGTLGLEETVLDPEGLTIIEWANRMTGFKPEKGYSLMFNYLDDDRREIVIKKI